MGYTIKTTFPKTEELDNENQKFVTTSRTEINSNKAAEDVIELYNQYQRQGYNVNVKFSPDTPESAEIDVSPFDIAHQLTAAGIDYKASLKINNSKDQKHYDDVLPIIQLIEAHGFDLNVDGKLKINSTSPVNINNPDTWLAEDADYKVSPKASSTNIDDLHDLYTDLESHGYDVAIDIKPKAQTDEEAGDSFAEQLAAYPDGTMIHMTLQDSE